MGFMGKKKGKKYLVVLAVLLAVTFMASSADALYDTPNKRVEMYVIANANTLGVGAALSTNVSTATIIPGTHRIIGYAVYPYDTSANAERYVGLYDATSTGGTYGMTTTYLFDEFEGSEANDIPGKWFPYPKDLTYGLSVRQGENSVVVIYYEDGRVF